MTATPEKRRHPRVKERLTLRSASAETGPVEMSTTNLSLGGAHVVSERYMPLMTRVEVTLHLPPDDSPDSGPRPVRAEAVVVRIHPQEARDDCRSFEMALFFSRMESRDRTALARYLSSQPQAV